MKLTSEDKLHIYFKKQLDSPDKKRTQELDSSNV